MALLFNEKALPVYREGFVKKNPTGGLLLQDTGLRKNCYRLLGGLFIDIGPSMI
jgi:hypothetical protein